MTIDLPQLIGRPGMTPTGAECRILRAALGLERRHIAAWAKLRGLLDQAIAAPQVATWEKGRGYPPALWDDLVRLSASVDSLAVAIAGAKVFDAGLSIARPMGARRIHQLMRLREAGIILGGSELEALNDAEIAREILPALVDAACVRAALVARAHGAAWVAVEMDSPEGR